MQLRDDDYRFGPTEIIWLLLTVSAVVVVVFSSSALAADMEKSATTVAIAAIGGLALIAIGVWQRIEAKERERRAQERVDRAEKRLAAHPHEDSPILLAEERDLWRVELTKAKDELREAQRDVRWSAWVIGMGVAFTCYSGLVGLWHTVLKAGRAQA